MSLKLIYDRYHDNIELSDLEIQFLKNSAISRLHQILQNSTAYLVFPSCRTSRFEHSIGTLNFASEIFINGINNSEILEEYLNEKYELIASFVKDDDSIFKIGLDTRPQLFLEDKYIKLKQLIPHDDNSLNVLIELIGGDFINRNVPQRKNMSNEQYIALLILFQSLRIGGLLHDVGHLPFSHLFEFALENIYETLSNKNSEGSSTDAETKQFNRLKSILNVSPPVPTEGRQIHEVVGLNITMCIFEQLKFDSVYNDSVNENTALKILWYYLIQKTWGELIKGKHGKLNSLYSIISGTLDADRLDFIQRDGSMSGIIKNTGNIQRIIKMFCLTKVEANYEPYAFLPSLQSLLDIEKVLLDRFNIYKYMVNHHAVKRSDCIMQRTIEECLLEEINPKEELHGYQSHDDQVINSFYVLDDLTVANVTQGFNRKIYEFTKISDYWLLALLSKKYADLIATEPKDNHNTLLVYLKEIYENRRRFKSLWKRTHEFQEFVEEIGKEIITLDFEAIEKYNPKNKIAEKFHKEIINLVITSRTEKINYFNLGISLIDFFKHHEGEKWTRKIEQKLSKEDDFILIAHTIQKPGIAKDQLLVNFKNKNQTKKFTEVSSINENLEKDLQQSIRFFVYFLTKNESNDELKTKLKKSLMKELMASFINIVFKSTQHV